MGGCPQTCMIKPRAASRVPRSHSAPPIRIPIFFAHSAQKISLCSCVGARKMSANARASSAFAPAFLAALIILVVMGECPQTCMNKLRIAPRSGAPAMLHTFVPRPASAALAALRCSVLMCGRSQMSARPDMQAYPSLRPLARCLIRFMRRQGQTSYSA